MKILLTREEYATSQDISRQTLYNRIKNSKLEIITLKDEDYIEITLDEIEKNRKVVDLTKDATNALVEQDKASVIVQKYDKKLLKKAFRKLRIKYKKKIMRFKNKQKEFFDEFESKANILLVEMREITDTIK